MFGTRCGISNQRGNEEEAPIMLNGYIPSTVRKAELAHRERKQNNRTMSLRAIRKQNQQERKFFEDGGFPLKFNGPYLGTYSSTFV
jgi:hypothetical protein